MSWFNRKRPQPEAAPGPTSPESTQPRQDPYWSDPSRSDPAPAAQQPAADQLDRQPAADQLDRPASDRTPPPAPIDSTPDAGPQNAAPGVRTEETPVSGPNTNYDPVQVTALDAETIDRYLSDALAAITGAGTLAELRTARVEHAGDRSPIALANREIGALPPQARKDAGRRVGAARAQINQALAGREEELSAGELGARLVAETVDVTLPVAQHPVGAQHPITAMIDTMSDIFVAMGWEVAEGPELEAEWLNFDALNFTPDHPARWTSDTLFVDPTHEHKLMRTHTSPVQIRSLLDRDLPVYVVCPGKVYRADEYDATHLPVFHQIEGLCVDKGISMADLRGTLDHFARALFGEEVSTRMRPHYFPFTEPSAEVDLRCFVCHGESVGNPDRPCRTCRSEGWIEWGGCGVVNPRVLAAAGIDPNVYSGFAFGMGVDRTVMFRNNAADLRDFVEGDIRFSRSLLGGAR